MKKKALILDLDNTIFPVPAAGDRIFGSLFRLIKEDGGYSGDFDEIRAEIMRRPFQKVAGEHGFTGPLKTKCMDLLNDLDYTGELKPFPDYAALRLLPCDKFLVTTGFMKLQQSKIRQLGIAGDFKQVQVIDPAMTEKTKKDVFLRILRAHDYTPSDVLVIGDDPESEIRAAGELGIDAVLYDPFHQHHDTRLATIADYHELERFV